MASLADLVTSAKPELPTRKALLILDLQNDFAVGGKLPVTYAPGLGSLSSLCGAFRTNQDVVAWVRTEFAELQSWDAANSAAGGDAVIVSSLDQAKTVATRDTRAGEDDGGDGNDSEEEFLRNAMLSSSRGALLKRVAQRTRGASISPPDDLFLSSLHPTPMLQCCQTTTFGADFTQDASRLIEPTRDLVVLKHTYSALSSTDLLLQLRARLVTHIYLCGTLTNVSVHATAATAVQHGMQVSIVEDCLGYVDSTAHSEALRNMREFMGASITSCAAVIRPSLKTKRSSMLPRISVNSQARENAPSSAIESPSPATRPRSRLPQPSPEGARVPSARSESRSSHNSPTSSRIPFARSESRASASSDISRRTSNLALRQKAVESPVEPMQSPQFVPVAITETDVHTTDTAIANHLSQLNNEHSNELEAEAAVEQDDDRLDFPLPIYSADLHRPVNGVKVTNGDSLLIENELESILPDGAFDRLKGEVYWQRMFHASGQVPRLVCAQGIIDSSTGAMPVYRHPADEALPLLHYSPLVDSIRLHTERIIGHPLNHCLVQLYRGGQDFISEHSDKTLDIVRGSWIVNVSLGAQRTMRLRTKRQKPIVRDSAEQAHERRDVAERQSHLITLPHGSIFLLGPEDNMTYLHGIQANKRPEAQKSPLEQAYGGERISLTFRYIGTFLDADSRYIWGQGATSKSRTAACRVINGVQEETQRIIDAFGLENRTGSDFDWSSVYGVGFDVLHFHSDQQEIPILFSNGDHGQDLSVELFFKQHGLKFVSLPFVVTGSRSVRTKICLRDSDVAKTQVSGLQAILIYLDRFYSAESQSRIPNVQVYRLILEMEEALALPSNELLNRVEAILSRVEEAGGGEYLGGRHFSAADCAYWLLIDDAIDDQGSRGRERWPNTYKYFSRLLSEPGMSIQWHEAAETI